MAARGILERVLEHNACWLLRRTLRPLEVAEESARFQRGVDDLLQWTIEHAAHPAGGVARELTDQGLPDDLARQVGAVGASLSALDLIAAAAKQGCAVTALAEQYHLIGRHLDLAWMGEAMMISPQDEHWAQLAKAALRDELTVQQRVLACAALDHGGAEQWLATEKAAVRRVCSGLSDLAAARPVDVAVLAVGV